MLDYPLLFVPRVQRPIVKDFGVLESYARQRGTVLGVAATTPYVHFVVDLVSTNSANGTIHYYPYLRVIPIGQLRGGTNVVIIAVIQNDALGKIGDVLLLEQERHATGSNELELPRGFAEAGLSGEENALKELQEETGYVGQQAYLLGNTYTDSGLTNARVFFYYIPVTSQSSPNSTPEEAINKVSLRSMDELWKQIDAGQIRDGFTLQALALYERYVFSNFDFSASSAMMIETFPNWRALERLQRE